MRRTIVLRRLRIALAAVAVLVIALVGARSGSSAPGVVFTDGFENGTLSQWTAASGMTAQQQEAFDGKWAARAVSTSGTAAWMYKALSPALGELYYDGRFKIVSQANNNVSVARFRTGTGGAIASFMRRNDGALLYYNEVSGVSTSGPAVAAGVWHELEVHLLVSGTASQVEVWLDGAQVASMSKTDNLGANPVGRVYVGEPATGRTFDFVFDNQVVSTAADVAPPSVPTAFTASAVGSIRVNLGWGSSTDNVGVAGYTVYRNGAPIATLGPGASAYSDTSVSSGSTYAYALDAFDAAGNHSSLAGPVSVSPTTDVQAPTVPAGLSAAATDSTHVSLTWQPSTDNTSVAGYTVFRGGVPVATVSGAATTSYVDAAVSPATSYSYSVDAFDASGNHSGASPSAAVTTPADLDTAPPTIPTGLFAAAGTTEIQVSWQPSFDNVGVSAYNVYRNGGQIGTVDGLTTSYVDRSVAVGTSYSYTVSAVDAAGNQSAQSVPAFASLLDTLPPDAPTGLSAQAASAQEVDLSWTTPADNVAVTGFVVYRDGAVLANVASPATSYADTTVSPSTTYSYTVAAFDGAGNQSSQSSPAGATTPAPPDLTPPSRPASLAATAPSPNRVDLTWTASTDNVGVSAYTIYRGANPIGTVGTSTTTYSDTTVAASTAYSYTVDAVDAAGNRSALSAAANVTTPTPPDLTPPTTPSGLTASVATAGEIDLGWNASTDNVGISGYTIFRNGVVVATVGAGSTGYADTSVVGAATYTYGVDAFDAAGNHSARATASASTPGTIFSDAFETGNLSSWTASSGLVVQRDQVYAGTFAARATTTGAAAYAYKTLSPALNELYVDSRFKFVSQTSGNDSIVRLRTSTAGAILSLLRRNTDGKLLYYNEVSGATTVGPAVSLGAWHELELHVKIAGASSQVDVWIDGTRIVSKVDSLGTAGVGRPYIGDPATGHAFDLAIDNVLVSTSPDVNPPTVPANVQATAVGATHVNVTWSASTDDQALRTYTVYRNGTAIASVGGMSNGYADTEAPAGASSSYTVDATDASGNRSAASLAAVATTPPVSSADPVIAAAGDIACGPGDPSFNGGAGVPGACQERATSDIAFNANIAALLPLGDTQYEDGTLSNFLASYDPTWGRLQRIVKPVPGNHEYLTANATGYFSYFGAAAGDPAKGYYSYNVGSWHIIALNSECGSVGGCGIGSPEETWLRNDLAQSSAQCTLAYWHEPRFSSGFHGDDERSSVFWSDLYAAKADVVLNGHDHDYERFAPQTPAGVPAADGIRQFVVGTGGAEHEPAGVPQPNSEVYDGASFGMLELTLHPTGYDWSFVPSTGSTFTDGGSGTCH